MQAGTPGTRFIAVRFPLVHNCSYDLRTLFSDITGDLVIAAANDLKNLGLANAGYQYVNIDASKY